MSKVKPDSDAEVSSLNSSQDDEPEPTSHKEKYSAETLMMMLDKQRLRALKKEFKEHQDGIELPNFVWLMKCALNVSDEEKADLVLGLYYLFQEIDINGDEHMEWSEFTQYIIDAVMSQQNREKLDNKELSPSEILDIAYSLKHIRFQASSTCDKNLHTGYIRYLKYFSSLDLLAFFESGSRVLKLVDHNLELKQTLSPELSSEAFIVAAAYSETEALLLIVSSDKKFHRFEKDKDGFRKLDRKGTVFHSAVKAVDKLWYFERLKLWLASCKDFNLRAYNMRDVDVVMTYKGHLQKVMDCVEIWRPFCFASCSLDQFVVLWNVRDGSKIGVIATAHGQGIRSMDYCTEYGGNLITVGFEREIKIWNPESNLQKCFTGKLEGHAKAVICCKFFRGKGICTSLDEEGNIRIWDVRQQTCLQIISNEKLSIDVDKLVILNKHEKFVLSGKRLMTFELIHNAASHEKLYDIKPLSVEFNSYYMQLVILTRFDIRIYDCLTGRLKKVFTKFKEIEETELSVMSLDRRNRVVIVGDSSGSLRTYNVFNGSHIKNIRDKNDKSLKNGENSGTDCLDFSEVSCFCSSVDDNILVTGTWGSSLMFFLTKNISEISLLRHVQGGHNDSDITCIAYSPFVSFVASGSSNGVVSIWDFEKGNLERAFFLHQHEITHLTFLDPYPLLLSCSRDGTNNILDLTRSKIQETGLKFFQFQTFSTFKGKVSQSFLSTSLNLISKPSNQSSQDSSLMCFGDQKGSLRLWDFSSFLKKNKIFVVESPARDRAGYNPFRRDKKNASSDLSYWRKKGPASLTQSFLEIDSELVKSEWQAHEDLINSLKLINDPQCLVSCSVDRFLKLWAVSGELWGVINLALPEVPRKWFFPFKWEKRRRADIEKVVELLSLIDSEIDFKPNLLSSEREVSKIAVKKEKKPKISGFQGFSYSQPEISKYQYLYESSFDEDHKEEKKIQSSAVVDDQVADLRRKLEEIDEKNGKEVQKTLKEPKSPFKPKSFREEEHDKSRNIKKLPQILQKSTTRSIKNLPSTQGVNSRKLFGTFNHLSKRQPKIQSPVFKPQKIEVKDVKFSHGASNRDLQKAISVQAFSRNSKILPFTEDLSVLSSIQREFKSFQKKKKY
jgi:WD40 repeat protein